MTTQVNANGIMASPHANGAHAHAHTHANGKTGTAAIPRPRSLTRGISSLTSAPASSKTPAVVTVPALFEAPRVGKTASLPGSSRSSGVVAGEVAAMPIAAEAPAGAGFIDAIGLRLSEQVNKVCLGVDFKAKRGFKKNGGWTLGEAVVRELPKPQSDAYLFRAVLRIAVRSLTIYLSRLEYFLLPAVTDATFATPLNLTLTVPSTGPTMFNPTQIFAISVCHTAWETCEVLEEALETERYPKFVMDMLRPVMDKLDSVVARVVTPLMGNLKKELMNALDPGASISPLTSAKQLPQGVLGGTATPLPPTLPAKAANHIPACLRLFAGKVDGARKVLEYIGKDCKEDGESWTATVVVATIWKGLCLCTTMYGTQDQAVLMAGRPPSPETMAKALATLAKDHTVLPAATTVGKMAAMLPSRAASRPSSPPKKYQDLPGVNATAGLPPTAILLASFDALIHRLSSGLVQKPSSPSEIAADPDAIEHLAREALGEALEAIMSMRIFVTALERGYTFMALVFKNLRDDVAMPTEKEEEILDSAEDAPPVLLFQLIAKKINKHQKHLPGGDNDKLLMRNPALISTLSGFGIAEEKAARVALSFKMEIERIRGELMHLPQVEATKDIQGWLNVLALALEARCDVVVKT